MMARRSARTKDRSPGSGCRGSRQGATSSRSRAGRWDQFIGHKISDVQLHYRPWAPNDGYWCTRVTITIRGDDIQLLGGQAEAGQTLAPLADNVAVIFPPRRLPEWELYDDGV
jgi:hypothetical protein